MQTRSKGLQQAQSQVQPPARPDPLTDMAAWTAVIEPPVRMKHDRLHDYVRRFDNRSAARRAERGGVPRPQTSPAAVMPPPPPAGLSSTGRDKPLHGTQRRSLIATNVRSRRLVAFVCSGLRCRVHQFSMREAVASWATRAHAPPCTQGVAPGKQAAAKRSQADELHVPSARELLRLTPLGAMQELRRCETAILARLDALRGVSSYRQRTECAPSFFLHPLFPLTVFVWATHLLRERAALSRHLQRLALAFTHRAHHQFTGCACSKAGKELVVVFASGVCQQSAETRNAHVQYLLHCLSEATSRRPTVSERFLQRLDALYVRVDQEIMAMLLRKREMEAEEVRASAHTHMCMLLCAAFGSGTST